jgi:sulfite exporter TauE/SafE
MRSIKERAKKVEQRVRSTLVASSGRMINYFVHGGCFGKRGYEKL